MAQCAGKSRRSGERCKQPPEGGSRYCRFHGGRAPRGPAHHFYKHGGYAIAAPERMQEDIQRIAADKQLLGLTNELVLLKARAIDLLKRVDTGESGKAWKEARSLMRAHDKALRAGDMDACADALLDLRRVLLQGGNDMDAWEGLQIVIRDITKVAESQRRYALEQHHMVSVETTHALMTALVEVVRRTVTDERTRDIIAQEFDRISAAQLGAEPAIEAEIHAA